jgi:flagellar biogenesis protein FliO
VPPTSKLIFVALLVFVGFFLLKKFRKPVNTTAQQPSANKMVACSVWNP